MGLLDDSKKDQDAYGPPKGFQKKLDADGARMGLLKASYNIRMPMGLLWGS